MAKQITVNPNVTYWNDLPEFYLNAINAVAKKENFITYDLSVSSGSNVGDGFMGIMMKVTISGWKTDEKLSDKGKTQTLKIIVKLPPVSKVRREQFNSFMVFDREIIIYNDYLPAIEKYQLEKGIGREEGFFNFPKCYHAEYNKELQEAVLILEDLGDCEFTMWNKFLPMDYNHCEQVITSLGRYHALSLLIKAQRPEVLEQFLNIQDIFQVMLDRPEFAEMWTNYFDQALAAFKPEETKYTDVIKRLKDNITDDLNSLYSGKLAEPYTVLAHGDCWINNFMFRRNGTFPVDIAFIDFQIARYSSPVLDLMYFIFVSTDKELRARHYKDLLSSYHKSASDLIRRCGEDPDVLYPRKALDRQLLDYGRFGLPMALMVVPMITTPSDELPDMDKVAEMMQKLKENPEVGKSEEFVKFQEQAQANNKKVSGRIREIIIDVFDFGYLHPFVEVPAV